MTNSAQPLSPEDEEVLQLLRKANRRNITELLVEQEQYANTERVTASNHRHLFLVGGALFGAGFLFAHFLQWLLK